MPYKTIGDIAEGLRVMRQDGMSREAIEYALDRVFEEPEPTPGFTMKFRMGQEVYISAPGSYYYYQNAQIVGINVNEVATSYTVRLETTGSELMYVEDDLETLR